MNAEMRDTVLSHVIAERVTQLEMDLVRIPALPLRKRRWQNI